MAGNTGCSDATSNGSKQTLSPAHENDVLQDKIDCSPLIIPITALEKELLELIDLNKYVKEKFSSDMNANISKQNGHDVIKILGSEENAHIAKSEILSRIEDISHIKVNFPAPISLFKKKLVLKLLRNELGKIPCSLMVDTDICLSSWTAEDCAKGKEIMADMVTRQSIKVAEDIAYHVCEQTSDRTFQKINMNEQCPWIITADKQENSIILHGIKSYNLADASKCVRDSMIKTLTISLSEYEFNYFSKFRIEKIYSLCEKFQEHSVQAMFLQSDKKSLFLTGTRFGIISVRSELKKITSALIISDSHFENEASDLIPSLLQLQENECVDGMVREVSSKCDCFIDVVAKEPVHSPMTLLSSELSAVQSVETFAGVHLSCGECVSCTDPGKEVTILLTSENADDDIGKPTTWDALYCGWMTSPDGKCSFVINMVVMGIWAAEMQNKDTVMFFLRSIPDFYKRSPDELATDILKTLKMYSKWTNSTHLKSVGLYSDNAALIQALTGYLSADNLMSNPPTSLVLRRDIDTGTREPTVKAKTVVFISDSEEKIKHAKDLLQSRVDEMLSLATPTFSENIGFAAAGVNENMDSSPDAKPLSQRPHGNFEASSEDCTGAVPDNEGNKAYFDETSELRQNQEGCNQREALRPQNQPLSDSFTEDDVVAISSADLKPENNDAVCRQLQLLSLTQSTNIEGDNISVSTVMASNERKDNEKEASSSFVNIHIQKNVTIHNTILIQNRMLPVGKSRGDDGRNTEEAMDIDNDQMTELWSSPSPQMIDRGSEEAELSDVVQLNREAEVKRQRQQNRHAEVQHQPQQNIQTTEERHQRTAGPTGEAVLDAATWTWDDDRREAIESVDSTQPRRDGDSDDDGCDQGADDVGGAKRTRDDDKQDLVESDDDKYHDAIDRVDATTNTTGADAGFGEYDQYEALSNDMSMMQAAYLKTENLLEGHHFEERCIIIKKFKSKDVTAEFLRSLFSGQIDAVVIPFQYVDQGLLVFSDMKDAKNALKNMSSSKNFKLEEFPPQDLVNVSADFNPDIVEACRKDDTLDDLILNVELRTGIEVKQHARSDRVTLFGTFLQITIASDILTNQNWVVSNRPRDDHRLSGSSALPATESNSNMVTRKDGSSVTGISGVNQGNRLSAKVNTDGRCDDKMQPRAAGNSKKKSKDEFSTTKFSKYGIKVTQKLFEDDFEKLQKSTKFKVGSSKNDMYEITFLQEKEDEVKGFLNQCVKRVENSAMKKIIPITTKDKNKVKSLKKKIKQMPGVFMSKTSNEVSLISFEHDQITKAYDVACQHLGRNKAANTNNGKRDQTSQAWSSYTNQGIRVLVYKANIIKLNVEAIVNATDSIFAHASGVSLVIMDAAGSKVEKECRAWSNDNGELTVGCYAVTSAGNLPCKSIIHVHGPRWDDYRDKKHCRDTLRLTIQNALFYCCNNNVKSIAFPAISSGIFGVPKEVCANAYRRAVDAIKSGSPVCLEEVHFVDIKDDILDAIKMEFEKLKEPENFVTTDENQVQSDTNVSATAEREYQATTVSMQMPMATPVKCTDNPALPEGNPEHRHTNSTIIENNPEGSSVDPFPRKYFLPYPEDFGIGFTSTVYRLSKSLEITVSTGDILKLTNMGVILSPEDAKCSGSNPFPAMLLSRGDNTYRSIHSDLRSKMASGSMHVVATNSGSLPCIKVIHVCHGSMTRTADYMGYRDVLMEAFLKAESLGMSGVAMPLMGADGPGGNLDHVSREFVTTIKEFHRTRSTCNVKQFHIVSSDSSLSNLVNICCGDILMDSSFARSNSQNASSKESTSLEMEKCLICLDAVKQPKTLEKCKHTFCSDCIDQVKVKSCPVCRTPYGIITGSQPHGTMKVRNDRSSLSGYPDDESIVINYNLPSGVQTREHPNPGNSYYGTMRTAYLPNNAEGQRLLKLLHVAFDRRLTFTVGTSVTSGKDDCVTWNDIHHKTNRHGGPDNFGYPDPTYFTRLSDELAAKGITDATLSSDVTTDPLTVTQHNAGAQQATGAAYNTRALSVRVTQPQPRTGINYDTRAQHVGATQPIQVTAYTHGMHDPLPLPQHSSGAQYPRTTTNYTTGTQQVGATQPLQVTAYGNGARSVITRSQSGSLTQSYGKHGKNTFV